VNRVEWRVVHISSEITYNGPGVYKIQLVDKNGKILQIPRLGGTDEEGVLAIGCSEHINSRRRQFVTSSAGKHGHSEGIQWWLVRYFSERARQTSLRFAFAELGTKEEAMRVETEEIQNYFKKYCEAPPLNGVIPKREEWFDRLRGR
jgi:hypothetical protein